MLLLLQVESFVLVLRALLTEGKPYRLVDFGSGTGNLLLPLAALFSWCSFHAVEMKPNAVSLLLSRAAAAGLTNVTAEVLSTLYSQLLLFQPLPHQPCHSPLLDCLLVLLPFHFLVEYQVAGCTECSHVENHLN